MGPIVQQHRLDKSILPALAARQPKFSALWWQYKEAGTYEGNLELGDRDHNKIQFIAPAVTEPKTIHLILEVKDTGTPNLTAFARVVITVLPNK